MVHYVTHNFYSSRQSTQEIFLGIKNILFSSRSTWCIYIHMGIAFSVRGETIAKGHGTAGWGFCGTGSEEGGGESSATNFSVATRRFLSLDLLALSRHSSLCFLHPFYVIL